ncbi:hypothetical protein BDZ91DRAFT_736820, partial [Kalaharituber pfeilii]
MIRPCMMHRSTVGSSKGTVCVSLSIISSGGLTTTEPRNWHRERLFENWLVNLQSIVTAIRAQVSIPKLRNEVPYISLRNSAVEILFVLDFTPLAKYTCFSLQVS